MYIEHLNLSTHNVCCYLKINDTVFVITLNVCYFGTKGNKILFYLSHAHKHKYFENF